MEGSSFIARHELRLKTKEARERIERSRQVQHETELKQKIAAIYKSMAVCASEGDSACEMYVDANYAQEITTHFEPFGFKVTYTNRTYMMKISWE